MRWYVVITVVLLALVLEFGVWRQSPERAAAQQPGDDFELIVSDMIDWHVLAENLGSDDVSSEFEDHLSAGRACRHLGQEISYQNGNERDYDVQAAFRASSGTRYVYDWTYDKSSSSGTSPSVPPDTISVLSESTPSVGSNSVLLSSQLSFEFLLEVLGNPPSMVSSQLQSKDLVKLWVEVSGSTYYLFLRFEDVNESPTTKRVWSTYSNGEFGTLEND